MPSTAHVLGWYAAVALVAAFGLLIAALISGCGDPVGPTIPIAHIPAVAPHYACYTSGRELSTAEFIRDGCPMPCVCEP